MNILYRIIHLCSGTSPHSAVPFQRIREKLSENARYAVHRPENFCGELAQLETGSFQFTSPRPLIEGASGEIERLNGLPRYQNEGICPSHSSTLFSLNRAGILGNEGTVYSVETGEIVMESVRQWLNDLHDHPALNSFHRFPVKQLNGISLSLLSLSSTGYYHFLLESLPRLALAQPFLEQVDHILISESEPGFQTRWLQAAGIPQEKITYVTSASHFHCQQLLFASHPILDQRATPDITKKIKALFPDPTATTGADKIWLTRRNLPKRHLQWENELLGQLPEWTSVDLETLSPKEQIACFHNARHIIAPHGASLANLVFCQPGTRCLEIFPSPKIQPLYARLAQTSQVNHRWATLPFDRKPDDLSDFVNSLKHFFTE